MNKRLTAQMRWSVPVSVAIAAIVASIAAQAEELPSEKDALKRIFSEPIAVSSHWVPLSSNQTAWIEARTGMRDVPTVLRYYTVRLTTAKTGQSNTTNDIASGYAVVHTVAGKHGPIRLIVAATPELAVIHTDILAFHERRGGAVRQRSFLSQFNGKNLGDALALHADIDGVTGATASSRAVARGVREALLMLSVLTARH
jgi:hypothetical protein